MDDVVAVEDALEQVAQPIGVLRPHDEIDLGHPPQQCLALLLWVRVEVSVRVLLGLRLG